MLVKTKSWSRLREPMRAETALEAEAWPLSLAVPHWQAEARLFRRQARRSYTPGMRQKINIADLYADALAAMPETIDGVPPLPVPAECPVTLDELLAE